MAENEARAVEEACAVKEAICLLAGWLEDARKPHDPKSWNIGMRRVITDDGTSKVIEGEVRVRPSKGRCWAFDACAQYLDRLAWTKVNREQREIVWLGVGKVRKRAIYCETPHALFETKTQCNRKLVLVGDNYPSLLVSVSMESECTSAQFAYMGDGVRIKRRTSYFSPAWRIDLTIVNEGKTLDMAQTAQGRCEVELEMVDACMARKDDELHKMWALISDMNKTGTVAAH